MSAGSTVSEPTTEVATTRIVPIATAVNTENPVRNMPAIATMTVMPEISTDRPEVAAAMSSAATADSPRARSSRSRLR